MRAIIKGTIRLKDAIKPFSAKAPRKNRIRAKIAEPTRGFIPHSIDVMEPKPASMADSTKNDMRAERVLAAPTSFSPLKLFVITAPHRIKRRTDENKDSMTPVFP